MYVRAFIKNNPKSSFQSLWILSGASCFRVAFFFFTAFKQGMKTTGVDESKIRGGQTAVPGQRYRVKR